MEELPEDPEDDLVEEIRSGDGFPQPSRVERAITLARLLRRQDGVVTLADLRRLGHTHDDVAGMVRRGDLVRLHRGVFGDGRTSLSPTAKLQAGLFAGGSGAFLSDRTGAGHRRLRPLNTRKIEISVPGANRRSREGLIFRRTRGPLERGDVTNYLGLPTASVPLILMQLAARRAPITELRELVDAAMRRNAIDLTRLPERIERSRNWPGIVRLRKALDGYVPKTHGDSDLEDQVNDWLLAEPRVPPFERNKKVGPWTFDFWFSGQHAALESDGELYHRARADVERDRRKDAWCMTHKIPLLRVTGDRFDSDRAGAMSDLLVMLGIDPVRRVA